MVCSICHQEVKVNADREKILTCGLCVQRLLIASKESKIAFRDKLLERGDLEAARSVESFIVDEETEPVKVRQRVSKAITFYRGLKQVRLRSVMV